MDSAEILANLQTVLTLLNPSLSLDEMLTNVARELVQMFAVDHSGVLFFGNDEAEGVVVAEYPSQDLIGLKVPLTGYPLMEILKAELTPLAVPDAQRDPRMGNARPTMRLLDIKSILIVPLVVQSRIVGSFSLDAMGTGRDFTPAEIRLCHIIGSQIAVAIDYTRALEAAEASRRQAQTLREVNRVLGESLHLAEILPMILDQLEKVVPADASSIFLRVEGGVQLVANRGRYSPYRDRETISLDQLWGAAEILQQRTPLLVDDTHAHPDWHIYPGSPLRSWLGVPLTVRGEAVGVLNIDGYSPHQFNETHIGLAEAFANQAAIALYNARLYGQAQERADLLASVQEIGLSMVASLDLEQVLAEVAHSVLTLLEAAGQVRVYLYNPEADSFTLAAGQDQEGRMKVRPLTPRKDGLTATVARTGRYLAVPTVWEHPLYQRDAETHGFQAIIGIPLKRQDKVSGVLNVFYPEPHHFSADEINLLHLLGTQAAVALENARLYSLEQARLLDEARRVERLRRVQELTSSLNTSLELDRVLSNACKQFVGLMEVDHCGVLLFNTAQQTGLVVAEYPRSGAVGAHIPLNPAVQEVLAERRPFVSFDTINDPRLAQGNASLKSLGVQSILILPLVVQDQVFGSIGLDAIFQPRGFSEEEINMGLIVADQVAIAVTNARTYQAERAARVHADTLREVAAALNETLNLDEVLLRILVQLERVITSDSSSILMRREDNFRIVAAQGFAEPDRVIGLTFSFAEKRHFQEIARTRRPLLIPDTALYEGWQQEGPTVIRSWIGAPLLSSDQLIGILGIDHTQPNFYTSGDGELLTAFAHLAAIALENARLYEFEVKQVEQELTIARQIQQGLFPRHIPNLPGWEIAAICLPARETGGDFYDFVERADGALGVVVGDVSGKSIPAAILMAAAQSVASAKATDHRSPARVLTDTNGLLCDDVPEGSFVALACALIQPDRGAVELSNGGQLSPFLVPAGNQPVWLVETPGPRLPLGILTGIQYQELAVNLAPGDTLVFHTDGIVERKNSAGRLFGFERLTTALEKMRGQPPRVILETLLQAADEFAGGRGLADDVTLVILQRRPAG